MKNEDPLKIGDKVSTMWGDSGIIARIISDNEIILAVKDRDNITSHIRISKKEIED
jgi:preprotein translocase subunit YajC